MRRKMKTINGVDGESEEMKKNRIKTSKAWKMEKMLNRQSFENAIYVMEYKVCANVRV